jgi:hypothetical protein
MGGETARNRGGWFTTFRSPLNSPPQRRSGFRNSKHFLAGFFEIEHSVVGAISPWTLDFGPRRESGARLRPLLTGTKLAHASGSAAQRSGRAVVSVHSIATYARSSNRKVQLHPGWEGCALPTELRPRVWPREGSGGARVPPEGCRHRATRPAGTVVGVLARGCWADGHRPDNIRPWPRAQVDNLPGHRRNCPG